MLNYINSIWLHIHKLKKNINIILVLEKFITNGDNSNQNNYSNCKNNNIIIVLINIVNMYIFGFQ